MTNNMKKVIEGEVNVVRINYRLTVNEGFAEVTVSFGHGSGDWRLHASFVPLEQREFVDALDRALPFEVIAKDGHGGCVIQGPVPEGMKRAEVMERIEAVYADTIVTG